MYESGENYLETILRLKERQGSVHSIDVARELNYSKPSVSRAVKNLCQEGYITMEDGGELELTPLGKEKAESIYERHKILTRFLETTIGVAHELAEADACKMEHIISDEVFEKIKQFVKRESGK